MTTATKRFDAIILGGVVGGRHLRAGAGMAADILPMADYPPQEAPGAFANAAIDVDGFR